MDCPPKKLAVVRGGRCERWPLSDVAAVRGGRCERWPL